MDRNFYKSRYAEKKIRVGERRVGQEKGVIMKTPHHCGVTSCTTDQPDSTIVESSLGPALQTSTHNLNIAFYMQLQDAKRYNLRCL